MVGLFLRAPTEQKSPLTTLFSQYVPYILTNNYSVTMYTIRVAIGFQMKKWNKTNTHGSMLQMSRLSALISCQLSESNQISVLHTELRS